MLARVSRDFFVYGFATYGILWTVTESFGAFFEGYKPEGVIPYIAIISISVILGSWKSWPSSSVQIKVPNSDSLIQIQFGNLFEHPDGIAIPVNEFFDSKLGNHVSEQSLHGQFIKNILGGQSDSFEELTMEQLNGHSIEHVERVSGRTEKYPIGTTLCIVINNKKYFLFVLSRTNINTLKASATVHELWDALAGLWKGIRNYSNGEVVAMPMIGSGLSGVGLPAKNLIDIFLTSFFYYTKKEKIAGSVTLILPKRLKTDIDLLTIKKNWRQ